MFAQVETKNTGQRHTRWHTMKRWLRDVDEGMNYDPQEHANALIKLLSRKIERLEARVNEIEEKRAAS